MNQKTNLLTAAFLLLFLGLNAQTTVTISGNVKESVGKTAIAFANVVLKTEKDSGFVGGTATAEDGYFSLANVKPGSYVLQFSYLGYKTQTQALFVGKLSPFLDLGSTELVQKNTLGELLIVAKQDEVSEKMDKKTFLLKDNISQTGGSVLQAMQNLPGVAVQSGKVQLRGSDKVVVLIDGKQTALTGFGSQSGLDNIPASAIEKIEIINNPSAKYDANGNAGIINIVYKTNKKQGFNGKIGMTTGAGALWVRQPNLPTITPQYTRTPKLNPNISLNYLRGKLNVFFQGDYLYTETLNKNEFVKRTYDNGDVINQQLKRNRNTHFTTLKSGVDYVFDAQNSITVSGLWGSEKIIDRGDQPFFYGGLTERIRLWQFLEDELKTTFMGSTSYQHKFKGAGNVLNVGFNYTFHRENEKYFYDNILPNSLGKDAFKLLSDEQVYDFTLDYVKPLKFGRLETGVKLRKRDIPTNMQFMPGANSVIDSTAGGKATYSEWIPAAYGNYVFETKNWEAELGLRMEYVKINYEVAPNHPTYKSDGYNYTQPFPNVRLAYKLNERNKVSFFYNRRVDRPNEVDIRIFPKYDDAEIIKVGNPALRPQFTNNVELGYKKSGDKGSFFAAFYHKFSQGTITRISSIAPGSNLIYAVFQNAGKSYNTGVEMVWAQEPSKMYGFSLNLNAYRNQINAFSVENKYPVPQVFSAAQQKIFSGNVKLNNTFYFAGKVQGQLSAVYYAPDISPQGVVAQRFSLDLGLKKVVQAGKGELFFNATDLLNTMVLKKTVVGRGFSYTSSDYYETQVLRLGYSYKF